MEGSTTWRALLHGGLYVEGSTTWRALLHGAGVAPTYIQDLLTPCVPTHSLRPGDECLNYRSHGPSVETPTGRKAFSAMAPGLWNVIPSDLRRIDSLVAYKTELKAYRFNGAFYV